MVPASTLYWLPASWAIAETVAVPSSIWAASRVANRRPEVVCTTVPAGITAPSEPEKVTST